MKQLEELLTLRDICARLKITPKTAYLWAARGRIPCLHANQLLRFSPQEISQWLRRRRNGGEKAAASHKGGDKGKTN